MRRQSDILAEKVLTQASMDARLSIGRVEVDLIIDALERGLRLAKSRLTRGRKLGFNERSALQEQVIATQKALAIMARGKAP